jgi:hypothetical protein
MARQTKGERVALYEGLLRATRDFADLTFQVKGPKTMTTAQAAPQLEDYLEAVKRTRRAEAALAAAIMAERKSLERAHPTAERLKAAVRARLGAEAPQLSRYGIRPTIPKRRKVEAVMRAVQQARATREARGAKGKRQRARGK